MRSWEFYAVEWKLALILLLCCEPKTDRKQCVLVEHGRVIKYMWHLSISRSFIQLVGMTERIYEKLLYLCRETIAIGNRFKSTINGFYIKCFLKKNLVFIRRENKIFSNTYMRIKLEITNKQWSTIGSVTVIKFRSNII